MKSTLDLFEETCAAQVAKNKRQEHRDRVMSSWFFQLGFVILFVAGTVLLASALKWAVQYLQH